MRISIVVLTCNQRELTLRCLRSLSRFIDEPGCELILVDNGSTDGTAKAANELFPKVKVIALDKNRGVAAGRNIGLKHAGGDYLMILDNDTIADRDTIFGLATYLQEHPEVGIVAPKLVSPRGEVQQSFKSFPGIGVKIRNVVVGRKRTSICRSAPESILEPFYLIGAAQMFPRQVYEMAGPLDENIFYGPEDADFCMKVRSLWKRVVYNPRLSIIHDWQRATTGRLLTSTARHHIYGLLYFYIKHKRFF